MPHASDAPFLARINGRAVIPMTVLGLMWLLGALGMPGSDSGLTTFVAGAMGVLAYLVALGAAIVAVTTRRHGWQTMLLATAVLGGSRQVILVSQLVRLATHYLHEVGAGAAVLAVLATLAMGIWTMVVAAVPYLAVTFTYPTGPTAPPTAPCPSPPRAR